MCTTVHHGNGVYFIRFLILVCCTPHAANFIHMRHELDMLFLIKSIKVICRGIILYVAILFFRHARGGNWSQDEYIEEE